MWAIAVKEFLQLRRDTRTVAMMLLLPFVFLVIFGYAASFDVKNVSTIVVGPLAQVAKVMLPKQLDVSQVAPTEDRAWAVDQIRNGKATAAVVTPAKPGGQFQLLIDGTNSSPRRPPARSPPAPSAPRRAPAPRPRRSRWRSSSIPTCAHRRSWYPAWSA